jgi:hypothetical protein
MKQLKLLLVLLTLGLIFLFAVPVVESSEIASEASALNNNQAERLQSEDGNLSSIHLNFFFLFNFLM